MGAKILEFPQEVSHLCNARIVIARDWSSEADFRFARRHLLTFGTIEDINLARRLTRARSDRAHALQQARANAAHCPMPAAVAASPGRVETARFGGKPLPAAATPDCPVRSAPASAEALSPAEAFSLKAERLVTRWLAVFCAACLAGLGGAHIGRELLLAIIPFL